ncbi:hypothetical protein E2562_008534 [Oryza meyeriana var. granulata]|uniref:Uncharacterized protein n=1 Tax=Oryza meyeriana var. granulata TaxID=110450 RepID=A0A6G1C5Y2_9ORYZ|nr:hypothetical protein E2562_008534 [Oryza meyeriana var. granulata]
MDKLAAAAAAAVLLAAASALASSGSSNLTASTTTMAYEMVERYGFPHDIPPEGVPSFVFAWLGIGQVDRAGDEVRYSVGPLSASFPLANFAEFPRCRCGFHCAAEIAAS